MSKYNKIIDNWPKLGFNYLIIPSANNEDWARRYDIEPFSAICHECGEVREAKHAFFSKEYNRRGFLAQNCKCGYSTFVYVDDQFGFDHGH
jgi:hypothetical protein